MRSFEDALAQLDDYLRGDPARGAAAEAQFADVGAYEEELFARALSGAAPELAFHAALGGQLRAMAARGSLDLWLTASGVQRVMASGLRVLRYELDLEQPQPPDLSGDFDLMITRFPIDLTGVRRLDAEVLSASGERLKVMPQIEFDPADGAIFACCEIELARAAAGSVGTITRLWAHDASGRRLVGELR